MEALYDAADEDAATGGPDLIRGIYPIVAIGHRPGVPAGGRRRRPAQGRRTLVGGPRQVEAER